VLLALGSAATPWGWLKEAAAPVASAQVALPLPAKVLTVPLTEILRILLLLESATYSAPVASAESPVGEEK
jgi:hypothetical protein